MEEGGWVVMVIVYGVPKNTIGPFGTHKEARLYTMKHHKFERTWITRMRLPDVDSGPVALGDDD